MRTHTFAHGEYYHLYNRGVDKRVIFNDTFDKKRFQYLMFLCNTSENIEVRNFFSINKINGDYKVYSHIKSDTLVDIGAYVLMPNHFHILVKEKTDGGVSKFMQKLQTGYTMFFNDRNDRSGALFQGRFKSQHVNSDSYLKYLYGYIHLNPLKLKDASWKSNENCLNNYTKILEKNNFSSYLDYVVTLDRPEKVILNPKSFPAYFETKLSHKIFIQEWIKIKADGLY
jgi:putative transposase